MLDEETQVLKFFLGEERSVVWVIGESDFFWKFLPGRTAIQPMAEAAHNFLSRRNRTNNTSLAALQNLSQALFAPIRDLVRAPRLTMVADDILHLIPLGLLSFGKEPANLPLLSRHQIVFLPSVSVLPQLLTKRSSPRNSWEVAVFADPVFQSSDPRLTAEATPELPATTDHMRRELGTVVPSQLERLHHSRREARALENLAPAGFSLALDFDASLESLKATPLADVDVLHLATHGVVDSRHPELSGLFFSQLDRSGRATAGFLGLRDVRELELEAELVVLSACSTALGRQVLGEGLIGLSRAFLSAGARRVLATLWAVPDQATALLMEDFYDRLFRLELAPAEALQGAQIKLRQNPRYRDPYYWGAFVLQGAW